MMTAHGGCAVWCCLIKEVAGQEKHREAGVRVGFTL